jgi:hypothetical protein
MSWTQNGNGWVQRNDDDPPKEIEEVSAKAEELMDFAKEKGVTITFNGQVARNPQYKVGVINERVQPRNHNCNS